MSTVSASDLKTEGVKAIEEALATQPEVAGLHSVSINLK
jgi:hypothetical protein